MSLNLMHFVQQLFQHPTASQAASNAHAQVQQLPAQHAVQLHQMLVQHPAVQQQLQAQPQHSPANLGVPYGRNPLGAMLMQGGAYNPGLIPLQGSIGAGTVPQSRAYSEGWDTAGMVNPQNSPTQQYWLP